jgi:hypothetical protein
MIYEIHINTKNKVSEIQVFGTAQIWVENRNDSHYLNSLESYKLKQPFEMPNRTNSVHC